MTLKFKKKDDEQDELPGGPEDEVTESTEEGEEVEGADVVDENDSARKLELENAEMRGKLSVLQGSNQNDPAMRREQIKATVYADANNLSDEDFQTKYKQPKHLAIASILEQDNHLSKMENRRLNAESRAEAELSAKYGADFYRFKPQIEESLADLSDEARMDAKRLSKHMERQFKALASAKPKAPKTVQDDSGRRKVVTDFDKPKHEDGAAPKNKQVVDEIAEADRPLAGAFGLTSEKERQSFMQDFVPMDMGGGIVYRDPKKGFEKKEPANAA